MSSLLCYKNSSNRKQKNKPKEDSEICYDHTVTRSKRQTAELVKKISDHFEGEKRSSNQVLKNVSNVYIILVFVMKHTCGASFSLWEYLWSPRIGHDRANAM